MALLLLELLEVGDVCVPLCQFLRFDDLCALSSLTRRVAALSPARTQFLSRACFVVPNIASDADVELFQSRIQSDLVPFIKSVRVDPAVSYDSHRATSAGEPVLARAGHRIMLSLIGSTNRSAWPFFRCTETLDLTRDMAAKLDRISQLTKLQSLDMTGHLGPDLAPLTQLTTLAHLYLNRANVGDNSLAHIASLATLETLEIRNCRFISDLSCLAGLVNLRRLVVGGNDVKDFSVLSKLTKLRHFEHVSTTRKSWPKVDFPLRAPELEYCDLARTPVHSVDFLALSPRLKHLNISWTTLSAAPPLGELKHLRVLIVSSPLPREAEYYAPLETLSKLERIEFHKIGRASLEPPVVELSFPARVRSLLVFP